MDAGYYTSAIEPQLQTPNTTYEFSKETLTEAKITLKHVIDFARLQKKSTPNSEDGLTSSSLEDETGVKSASGIVKLEKDGYIGHIKWWAYFPHEANDKPPIIALHGGPAFTHNYMLPLKLLAYPEFGGYPVIFYDQCGCGASSRITSLKEEGGVSQGCDDGSLSKSVPPHLLTIEYYVEEFLHLVRSWNDAGDFPVSFKNGYYTYGSSWGSILAQEVSVYLKKNMDSEPSLRDLPLLRGMVLDGALSDAQLYCRSQWKYRVSRMPSFSYHLLKKLDHLGSQDEPQIEKESNDLPKTDWFGTKTYKDIERVLTSMFTTRLVPLPDFWHDCFTGMNSEIYAKVQGCSEFTIGGVLKNWSIADRLPCLSMQSTHGSVMESPLPVLILAGEFDTMTIECHQHVLDSLGGGERNKLVVIPRAGHCKLVDEPFACCEEVLKFIQ